jgi:penicillin-binding protein 1B
MTEKRKTSSANNKHSRTGQKKRSPAKPVQSKAYQRWLPAINWRWLMLTSCKLLFTLLVATAIYGIYLDGKVRQTFEGQRWQLPAQIYGRVIELSPGEKLELATLKKRLLAAGYKKVHTPQAPGEFAMSEQRAIIYQRSFDFGSHLSKPERYTLDVTHNVISNISDDNHQPIDKIALEPVLLARLDDGNHEDRILVTRELIPEKLLDTLILVEDRDFYHHHGISPVGILRAAVANLFAGRIVQGGSTLTQQLAKNMYLSREKKLWRKVNEALIALLLEYRYSKDQLLEAYVNEVYLGQHYADGIYGFGLGAQFYFGKPLQQLNNAEIALLVGQIKGPSYYDPWRHGERALNRRDLVLKLMFEHHFIDRYEFEQAINSPLSIRQQRRFNRQNYPGYLQLVKKELRQHLSDYQQQSGIKVFTGFDLVMQNHLETSINSQLTKLEQNPATAQLQTAMLVTDIASGEIRALSGDRDSRYAGFNRAVNAKRHIGSLIKPAVYAAALERFNQYNFATVLKDQAVSFKSDRGNHWQPKNYDGKHRGQVNLLEALVHSYNIPTVNLGIALGLPKVAATVNALGYPQELQHNPAMLLGAVNMSPYEVNQWYLTLAAQGQYIPSHAIDKIVSFQGETLWQFEQQAKNRLSQQASYLIDYALTEVSRRGTAKSLAQVFANSKIAGKTGTSNDLRDSWFVGYDQQLLVTTWLGRDDNKPMGLTGSSGALTIYRDFMLKQGVNSRVLQAPADVGNFQFELATGNAVGDNCLGTVVLPAVRRGILLSENCLEEKKKSWFEFIFGD